MTNRMASAEKKKNFGAAEQLISKQYCKENGPKYLNQFKQTVIFYCCDLDEDQDTF